MDPWACDGKNADVCVANYPAVQSFEDNFSPAVRHTLPDSEQYLATLEEKLRKIKNDTDVLKQLAAKREACMQNLLNDQIQLENNEELDAPVGNSQLLRTILPQKQALNKGEVVELVNYDQLSESDSEKESK